ncbi:hypothetical protein [Streptomyces sp. UNOC14_S4]|uniref:hypothetical protein n=1 Tax=Streptomyces sp. UNOC14_S4 TaxID=2872340 RepID=UPI001E40165C|nr:hypothetical protein [Streptomyces sp. UNOC14_S4]MCC3767341.1 hypothetical protein [Streptomyces sp. UNOC14_S4]
MAAAPITSTVRPDDRPLATPPPAAAHGDIGTAGDPTGPALRPWLPPVFTDIELGEEVTAYAGRW